jgi:hypothetical protein
MTTPQQIGKYTVSGEIASGAQGAVYRAIDPSTAMTVAVKVLIGQRVTDVDRFRREASLVQAIDHQNVVKLIEVGESEGRHFMAMEFIPETLSNLIEVTGALPVERAIAIAIGISDGLGYAHQQGIVHHDIKPQNILMTPDGIPKVTDFGIARGEMLNTMTATGAMMGTPYYMSPEQANGERGDPRSDVYSIACLLYQLLSGEVPFSGGSPLSILRRHVEESPQSLKTSLTEIPDAVARCVEQAMSKDPSQRFADGNAFASALRIALPAAVVGIPQEGAGKSDSGRRSPEILPERRRSVVKVAMVSVATVAVVGLLAVTAFLMGSRSTGDTESQETVNVEKEAMASNETTAVIVTSTWVPTAVNVPAPTPVPTAVNVPAPTPVPTAVNVPAPTAVPTAVKVPAPTAVPTAVNVPAPTAVPTQTPEATPTQTRLPTPVPTTTHAVFTTIDSTGNVGKYTSVTIGADGLGLISYYDETNDDLKVAHCSNMNCTSATTSTIDSTGNVGSYTSITIGADGLGLISYYQYSRDPNTGGGWFLKVAHCSDTNCTTVTITTLDSAGHAFRTSIAMGSDGLGLISYKDRVGGLKVAHCSDTNCTTATTSVLDSAISTHPSVAIGADGLGLISYRDADNEDLKVAHCSDTNCTTSTITTLDSTGDVGYFSSVAIGTDGLGLISYQEIDKEYLKVAHCSNTNCTTSTITTLDNTDYVGYGTSITIGVDGFGLISYQDRTNDALKIAHCSNTNCTTSTITTLASAVYSTHGTSITIGADGLGLISYFDRTNDDLKVAHCSNTFCSPFVPDSPEPAPTPDQLTELRMTEESVYYAISAVGIDDHDQHAKENTEMVTGIWIVTLKGGGCFYQISQETNGDINSTRGMRVDMDITNISSKDFTFDTEATLYAYTVYHPLATSPDIDLSIYKMEHAPTSPLIGTIIAPGETVSSYLFFETSSYPNDNCFFATYEFWIKPSPGEKNMVGWFTIPEGMEGYVDAVLSTGKLTAEPE